MNQPNVANKIILHHSADTEPGHQLVKINDWHKERGFNQSSMGWFVGYHFLIEKDGTQTQTRDLKEMGCHCIGQNFTSIGICLAGNFDEEDPTPAQIERLSALMLELCTVAQIPETEIYPHRWFSQTDCNGLRLDPCWGLRLLATYMGEKNNEQQPCAKSSSTQ